MNSIKTVKTMIISGAVAVGLLLAASSSLSKPAEADQKNAPPTATAKHSPEEFVGSETCQACHEDQFNSFSKTAHAKLARNHFDANGGLDVDTGCGRGMSGTADMGAGNTFAAPLRTRACTP